MTGYEPQDLIEKTLYQYVHCEDMIPLRQTHVTCEFFLVFTQTRTQISYFMSTNPLRDTQIWPFLKRISANLPPINYIN